jgi:RNA polymerase sigma factor (sigma-70 family)
MLQARPFSVFRTGVAGPALRPVLAGNGGELAVESRHAQFAREWAGTQLPVRAYLASFLGNAPAVEDCLQEVALVVWKKAPLGEGPSAFLAYALACAKRIALAARRRLTDGRLQLLSPEVATALADTVALQEHLETRDPPERLRTLRRCLEQLPAPQRELVEARYAHGTGETLAAYALRTDRTMDCLYKKLERLRELLRACVNRRQLETE